MSKNPYIMIIMPFKGNVQLSLNAINSLKKSYTTGFSYSMLLWDDGSNPQEIEDLYQYKNFPATIIKHNHVGYTQAVHDAFEIVLTLHKEYDYILLANNDILFHPATLYYLSKRMTTNPNIAAVGCKVLKFQTDEILHTGVRLENGKIVDPYVNLDKDEPSANFVERRLWVNGCCTLYNADILRKHSLNFNVAFSPAYFEESNLMSNLNLLGYTVLYEPRAEIQHIMNATTGLEREKYQEIFHKNWNLYLSLWEPHFKDKSLQF